MIRFELLYELYCSEEDPTETLRKIEKFFDKQKDLNRDNASMELDDLID